MWVSTTVEAPYTNGGEEGRGFSIQSKFQYDNVQALVRAVFVAMFSLSKRLTLCVLVPNGGLVDISQMISASKKI